MTVRYSNTEFLTVLDPIGLENIGWEVEVISPTDWATVLAYLPRFSEIMLSRVANDIGSGSITLDADDPVLHDPLPLELSGTVLDRECLYRFYKDGIPRFEWLGEDTQEDVATDDESRVTKISGRTTEQVLEWGVAAPGQITVKQPDPKAKKPKDWSSSRSINDRRLQGNVARLWIGKHDMEVGWPIQVSGVNDTYNKVGTITAKGKTWIEYACNGANEGKTSSAGSVKAHPAGDEWLAPLIDVDIIDPMTFEDVPAIEAFRWLVLENIQPRGTLPFLTLMFDGDVDSEGQAWTDVSDITIDPGETPLALIQRLSAALGWEFKMLPGFRLFVSQEGFGQHREAEVKHFIAGSQQQHGVTGSTRDVATSVFAQAQDGSIAQAIAPSDATPWTREQWLEAGDAKGISGANRVANASVQAARNKAVGRTVKVVDDQLSRTLFDDYDVQDWITVEDEKYRSFAVKVTAATITVNADTDVDLELTIQTKFEARQVKVARMLEKLGASAAGSASASIISRSKGIAATTLGDLADVNTAGVGVDDILQFDGQTWNARSPDQITADLDIDLGSLDDVDLDTTVPTDGQSLGYDADEGLWIPKDALDLDLSTPPTYGQTLVWNGTMWVPGDSGGGGGGSAAVGCRAYRAAAWTAATTGTGVQSQIPFDASDIDDVGSMWSSSAPAQIVVPFDGWWRVEANLQYSNGIASYARIQIRVNGVTVATVDGDVDGAWMTQHVDRSLKLVSGDVVTAWYEKRSGGGGTAVGPDMTYLQVISM